VYFFDAEGRQMAGFDIAVTRDLNGIRAAIRQSCRRPISASRASARAWC
jgi:Flp pilus assembly secretin CpaC